MGIWTAYSVICGQFIFFTRVAS